jgi:hypothetical protein
MAEATIVMTVSSECPAKELVAYEFRLYVIDPRKSLTKVRNQMLSRKKDQLVEHSKFLARMRNLQN